ncbi:hypothetical protein [Vibrio cholerae]|uniref:hypothetical protein n=1 Tax=Vibrio cholerae TaxID=666 RepID=UPI001E461410|nr:hypothetical protein [Vibrio cholerae]MCD6679027.1 hypothetical protein [Vibrio cholerae]
MESELHQRKRDIIIFGERYNHNRWRLVSNDQNDIGQCAEYDHRGAAKFTVVEREEKTAALLDNRAFYAPLMVDEIKLGEVIKDSTAPPNDKHITKLGKKIKCSITMYADVFY